MNYLQQNLYWLFPLIIIEGVLKAFALWRAGRNNQLYWFIAIVVLNTAGILPIIYMLFFERDSNKKRI
ncbi:MAG TPA: DUF5652 family protein [Patescibacteria group bacterium]|nr:DUF5652 family protein [Patescibacteria group bacterium]